MFAYNKKKLFKDFAFVTSPRGWARILHTRWKAFILWYISIGLERNLTSISRVLYWRL